MSKREPRFLLEDILECAEKVRQYTNSMTYDEFIEDSKTIDAVIRNLEVIGEAANRLPDEYKDAHSQIDWYKIRGLRNRIVHHYFGIDYQIIWLVKEEYLPELVIAIKILLKES